MNSATFMVLHDWQHLYFLHVVLNLSSLPSILVCVSSSMCIVHASTNLLDFASLGDKEFYKTQTDSDSTGGVTKEASVLSYDVYNLYLLSLDCLALF